MELLSSDSDVEHEHTAPLAQRSENQLSVGPSAHAPRRSLPTSSPHRSPPIAPPACKRHKLDCEIRPNSNRKRHRGDVAETPSSSSLPVSASPAPARPRSPVRAPVKHATRLLSMRTVYGDVNPYSSLTVFRPQSHPPTSSACAPSANASAFTGASGATDNYSDAEDDSGDKTDVTFRVGAADGAGQTVRVRAARLSTLEEYQLARGSCGEDGATVDVILDAFRAVGFPPGGYPLRGKTVAQLKALMRQEHVTLAHGVLSNAANIKCALLEHAARSRTAAQVAEGKRVLRDARRWIAAQRASRAAAQEDAARSLLPSNLHLPPVFAAASGCYQSLRGLSLAQITGLVQAWHRRAAFAQAHAAEGATVAAGPNQCRGTTLAGERCQITSLCDFAAADPLRLGDVFCAQHYDQHYEHDASVGASAGADGSAMHRARQNRAHALFRVMLERERELGAEYVCLYHCYSRSALMYEVNSALHAAAYGHPAEESPSQPPLPLPRLLRYPYTERARLHRTEAECKPAAAGIGTGVAGAGARASVLDGVSASVLARSFSRHHPHDDGTFADPDADPAFREVAIAASLSLLGRDTAPAPLQCFDACLAHAHNRPQLFSYRHLLRDLLLVVGGRRDDSDDEDGGGNANNGDGDDGGSSDSTEPIDDDVVDRAVHELELIGHRYGLDHRGPRRLARERAPSSPTGAAHGHMLQIFIRRDAAADLCIPTDAWGHALPMADAGDILTHADREQVLGQARIFCLPDLFATAGDLRESGGDLREATPPLVRCFHYCSKPELCSTTQARIQAGAGANGHTNEALTRAKLVRELNDVLSPFIRSRARLRRCIEVAPPPPPAVTTAAAPAPAVQVPRAQPLMTEDACPDDFMQQAEWDQRWGYGPKFIEWLAARKADNNVDLTGDNDGDGSGADVHDTGGARTKDGAQSEWC